MLPAWLEWFASHYPIDYENFSLSVFFFPCLCTHWFVGSIQALLLWVLTWKSNQWIPRNTLSKLITWGIIASKISRMRLMTMCFLKRWKEPVKINKTAKWGMHISITTHFSKAARLGKAKTEKEENTRTRSIVFTTQWHVCVINLAT